MKLKCSIPIKHDGKTYGIGEVIELKDIEFIKAYITHRIEDDADEEKEELSNEQGYQGKENSNQQENSENKTVKELREIAKEKEVVGYGNMNKG